MNRPKTTDHMGKVRYPLLDFVYGRGAIRNVQSIAEGSEGRILSTT